MESDIINLGNRVVNNYLVKIDDGYALIDTGYDTGFKRFLKKIKKFDINPQKIKYIMLTHAHDDHAGFINEVLSITPAEVVLHPLAVEFLKAGSNSEEGGYPNKRAYRFCKILSLFGGASNFKPLKKEFYNRLITTESERFEEIKNQLPFSIIHTPGHTADHISLKYGKIMFCGDAAMNNFPSINRFIIWIEDVEAYRQSWLKIINTDCETIYPAHGKPFKKSDLEKYISKIDDIKLIK